MGTGDDDTFAKALEHALAAGRNRATARCLPAAAPGLLKVAEFHRAVAARFVDQWLQTCGGET